MIIEAARIFSAGEWLEPGWIEISGDLIQGVGQGKPHREPDLRIAASLVPGFVDAHIHGGGGYSFNDADPAAAGEIVATHQRHGTTTIMASLVTAPLDQLEARVRALAPHVRNGLLAGIHLEGPFISRERKGVHAAAFLHSPDADELRTAGSLRHGKTVLTLAPECVPADAIRQLVAAGVIVVAGHSNADYATVRAALDAGVRGFTHLYNAMSPLGSRAPGMVGAALDDADAWCGVIVDGHHVDPASLRIALKAKPRGKVLLVTDAMPPVGAADPAYVLNGETIVARDGICQTANGTLAGSALSMIDAVRNAVAMLGVTLEEAARMASTYPADFLGLAATHGRIAPGYRADFTVVDRDLRVTETWIGGTSLPA